MPNPLLALTIGLLIIVLGLILFRPRRGLAVRWRQMRRMSARVLSEDALKHLFKVNLRGGQATLQSIAGALQVDPDRVTELLTEMEAHGLVHWVDGHPMLTNDGRDYALHIIRAHRLWERFLADRTGYEETEWHHRAETREHMLSRDDVGALAARLGHPTYDPHGDPIPTADGTMPPHVSKLLSTVAPGDTVRIVHIEDEPETVYAQLVAEGLAPGMIVRVLKADAQRISFWADHNEHILAPILANNISVVPVTRTPAPEANHTERLSDLRPGESGHVLGISKTCHGAERRRLLDLGLIPGTVVEAAFASPSRDPMAYTIRGTLIALRQDQASRIHIRRIDPANDEQEERQHPEPVSL